MNIAVQSKTAIVDTARSLANGLRARARQAERDAELPPSTIRELHETGLFRILQPARVGGGELGFSTLLDVSAELARGCASTAWVMANLAARHWMLAMFPRRAQDAVWGEDRDALAAGALIFSAGKARAVAGGYVISGKWPFASGIRHATWCVVAAGVTQPDGTVDSRLFLIPAKDYAVERKWEAMGLAGTGSDNVSCEEVFVDQAFSLSVRDISGGPTPGHEANPSPLYQIPVFALFPYTLSGVALGNAQGLLDDYVAETTARVSRYGDVKIGELQSTHLGVARASAQIDAAALIMRTACREAEQDAALRIVPAMPVKARYRRDGAYAVELCSEAVAGLFGASGSGAILLDHPAQRSAAMPRRSGRISASTSTSPAHSMAAWPLARTPTVRCFEPPIKSTQPSRGQAMSIFARLWAAAVAMAVSVGAAPAAETVKVGVIGPFTGPAATSGIAMKRAFEFTAKQVNDAGGVAYKGGKANIELIFEDSQSRPDVGVSAAQKLLTRDNVDVLLAELLHSSVALAIMELSPAYDKIFMSGQPVSIEIANRIAREPDKYKNFWKHDFNSDASSYTLKETVKSLVEQGKLKPKNKTVAFVIEDSDFARANVEYATKFLQEDGWSVVATEAVPLAHTDFYPQISKLRSQQPDVIYSIFTSANSGIALVKQFHEQGIEALHLATYYPTLAEFIKGAGKNAEGLVLLPFLFDAKNNPNHKAFADKFAAFAGTTVSMDHGFGACAAEVLFDVIDRAGDVTTAALNKAFLATDYNCAVGRWVFDPATHSPKVGVGYLTLPAAQIQDGSYRAIWPADAPGAVPYLPTN